MKKAREENNRSEYILDNNKTSKLIKHLTFPPKQVKTHYKKKQNKKYLIVVYKQTNKNKICNETKVYRQITMAI